ncbi:olfactory receptor 5p57-like [Lepus europaeus]|uniref:olfactory receptor 5p57-like n=1 Tax=Lepus europaeus TaxID=9983 RepID=UPI002B487671|nr:olfactory receptor 5p57-like [Lepus europaeus]
MSVGNNRTATVECGPLGSKEACSDGTVMLICDQQILQSQGDGLHPGVLQQGRSRTSYQTLKSRMVTLKMNQEPKRCQFASTFSPHASFSPRQILTKASAGRMEEAVLLFQPGIVTVDPESSKSPSHPSVTANPLSPINLLGFVSSANRDQDSPIFRQLLRRPPPSRQPQKVKMFLLSLRFHTVFSSLYLCLLFFHTLLGNVGVITVIHADPQLHTPVHFFLSVLSFLDSSFSTVVDTPLLLGSFLTSGQSFSFAGCVVQMALMTLHGSAGYLLLATMACDWFSAICHPLLYLTVRSQCLCVLLVAATYIASVANSALLTGCIFRLPYCGPNIISHYFCDIPPGFHLACSYACILASIYRMHSLVAQSEALSTCASHFTITCLFYGTVTYMYAQPSSLRSMEQKKKVVSIFYTIIIPMLNPPIHSLRNKDGKAAFKRSCFDKLRS